MPKVATVTRRGRSSGRQGVLATAALAAVVFATPVSAVGPAVTVSPTGPLPAGAQTLTVAGQGFDAQANTGAGIYVVFGPITAAPSYYTDPSIYGAFKWVYPGGVDSAATAPMTADGTFSTTLDIASSFVAPTGTVDCSVVACGIITFAAHGAQDRTQDTCIEMTFLSIGPGGSLGPAMSAGPASPAPQPTSAVVATGSSVPGAALTAGGACAAINAAAAP